MLIILSMTQKFYLIVFLLSNSEEISKTFCHIETVNKRVTRRTSDSSENVSRLFFCHHSTWKKINTIQNYN